MRWWSELKYVVKKLNRRRAERELQEEIERPLGDGDPGEDRRRALSGGGAVRGASRAWQRRFGDGGQSRLVGVRRRDRVRCGRIGDPSARQSPVRCERARSLDVRRRDGAAGSDCVPGLLRAGATRDQSGPNGRIATGVIRRLFDDVTGDPMARSSSMIASGRFRSSSMGQQKGGA